MSEQRPYDVVLWGATGFTGELVARALWSSYGVGEELRWALAGRNAQKLEKVREGLQELGGDPSKLDIVLADSQDLASLKAMAAQTQVLCSTVGPYAKYGTPLVEACIQEGADYCDLTGEVPWVRKMIDEKHESAEEAQVRIVHCCGFDSIPSDLGWLMMQEAMLREHGVPCEEVRLHVGKFRGGVSGGTIASMMNVMEEAADKATRKLLRDPYSLNPPGAPRGPDGGDLMSMRWDPDIEQWTCPFVMAAINTRIVRRSHALLGHRYGEDTRYSEVTSCGSGLKAWWRASTQTWGLGLFAGLAAMGWSRKLMQKTVLPAPGEGPSPSDQEKGYFNAHFWAKAGEHRLYGLVYGSKDPGYGQTAIMLAEAAVCLALQREALPERYGILTPATAMGEVLTQRLREAGMVFETSSQPIPPRS